MEFWCGVKATAMLLGIIGGVALVVVGVAALACFVDDHSGPKLRGAGRVVGWGAKGVLCIVVGAMALFVMGGFWFACYKAICPMAKIPAIYESRDAKPAPANTVHKHEASHP